MAAECRQGVGQAMGRAPATAAAWRALATKAAKMQKVPQLRTVLGLIAKLLTRMLALWATASQISPSPTPDSSTGRVCRGGVGGWDAPLRGTRRG